MKQVVLYIAFLFILGSCTKMDSIIQNDVDDQTKSTIKVYPEATTKTLINGTIAKFLITDALDVYEDTLTTPSRFNLIAGYETNTAVFSGTYQKNSATIRHIYAVYPSGAGKMSASGGDFTFMLPNVQVQNGGVDSINLGSYSYMVGTPVDRYPTRVANVYLNQITSIIDFELKNIPHGKRVTKIVMKEKSGSLFPFIRDGVIDITKKPDTVGFLKLNASKLENEFAVVVNNAPQSDFTASLVVFPFAVQRADMSIIVSTVDTFGVAQTYTFDRNNLDLSLFQRRMRTATTIDFNGVSVDAVMNQSYNVWDGETKTQPLDLDNVNKKMTILRGSDLAWLADQTNNYYTYDGFNGYEIKLGANLDLGGVYNGTAWIGMCWTPIGSSVGDRVFKGSFDGAGYKIKNLYNKISYIKELGLFGKSAGRISNVHIESGYLTASTADYAGGICGYSLSPIENCTNNAQIVSAIYYAGGICGFSSSTISRCVNNGTVKSSYLGGICGYCTSGIDNCINNGAIVGTPGSMGFDVYAGGICGYSPKTSVSIRNCINNGAVSALLSYNPYAGGICGYAVCSVSNCLNCGNIYSKEYAGGICGATIDASTIQYCGNKGSVTSTKLANASATCGMRSSATVISYWFNSGKIGSTQ